MDLILRITVRNANFLKIILAVKCLLMIEHALKKASLVFHLRQILILRKSEIILINLFCALYTKLVFLRLKEGIFIK